MVGLRRKKQVDADLASAVSAMTRLDTLTDRLEATTAVLEELVQALRAEEDIHIEEVGHGDARAEAAPEV